VKRQSLQGCIANVSLLFQAEPTEVWTPLDWTTATAYRGASAPSDGCPLLARTRDAQTAVHFLGTGKDDSIVFCPHGAGFHLLSFSPV